MESKTKRLDQMRLVLHPDLVICRRFRYSGATACMWKWGCRCIDRCKEVWI